MQRFHQTVPFCKIFACFRLFFKTFAYFTKVLQKFLPYNLKVWKKVPVCFATVLVFANSSGKMFILCRFDILQIIHFLYHISKIFHLLFHGNSFRYAIFILAKQTVSRNTPNNDKKFGSRLCEKEILRESLPLTGGMCGKVWKWIGKCVCTHVVCWHAQEHPPPRQQTL